MSSNPENRPASHPSWLNSEFVEKQLRNHYKNDEIKVVHLTVKSTSGDFENFASQIYRAKITFKIPSKNETNSVNVIVKEGVSDELSLKILLEYDIYNKEMEFYGEIVPKFNENLKLLDEPSLLAEAFGVCKQRNVLILEDLSVRGHKSRSGADGLNANETKAILKRLATFHAIGAVLQEEQPNIFANFKYGQMSRVPEGFSKSMMTHFNLVIEEISEWENFEVYAEKLRHLHDDFMERGHQIFDVNSNHFNTLVHGDLWNTNLMIKSDTISDNKPFENIIFIDFQYSLWSSPTIDLHFFLNSSVCDDLRPQHFDEFVRFYHEQLVHLLEQLNFKKPIPTWTEFYAQYRERNFYAFIVSCLMQPVFNSAQKLDGDELISPNEQNIKNHRSVYQNNRIRTNLRKLIPYYDQIGIFDRSQP